MRLIVHAPVLIGLAAACTATPSPLAWTIDFAPGAPRPPEVTAVRAWIRAGGCEGGETIYSAVLTPSGPMVATPPRLDDGTWGFGAEALDAECRTIAQTCEDVVTPSASRVALLLDAVDPPSGGCAASARCEAGTCAGGLDAGAIDAGPIDAGVADSGRMDSGGSCPSTETDCDDGIDDDCDAMTDCADPDCAGRTCAAGARCGGGVCCSTCVTGAGACVAGTSWNACGTGGEACARCGDCVACNSGRCADSPSAGAPCGGGVCVGSASPTCCTGCIAGDVLTGTCDPGTTNAACGKRGESCATCVDAVCTRNECCGGCLLSSGVCWPGTGGGNCGTAGAACESCGAGASCCDAASGTGGVCVAGGCP